MKPLFYLCFFLFVAVICSCNQSQEKEDLNYLRESFVNPPDSARPGVYWYFMDGNMSKEGMTKDLESMKEVGIGHVVFLEVNIGIPRGDIDLLSEEWLDMFDHLVNETERLGITITLGVGPGWTGSGGPWVKGSESMKHLVSSITEVKGSGEISITLPVPESRDPYFGLHQFPESVKERWENYYEDVAVVAFPTPENDYRISDIDEKALYYREPYTSKPGIKPFLPAKAEYERISDDAVINRDNIQNITEFMDKDGTLNWNVPEGNWTIMRLGSRNNGAITRPAPMPGVGFEADKFDTSAINAHLRNFTEKLFKKTGVPDPSVQGGLKMLHMDSWEMGAQNWTDAFREEFQERRGYDPLPFYPVYAGLVVGDLETSERFLWDLRQTSMELVIENHANHLKEYGRRYNMRFSIEPYDMNPTADMELGSVADIPMCEFWSKDYGFISAWSCIQAASIAHINANPVVAAEAFTAYLDEWRLHPGNMKNQGDWAFAAGINRLVYHTFQHQCLPDSLKPGMTMGPYGVHHDRNQTWWPMADGYHNYVSRCQFMLQQGKPVAEMLYLNPEGAPQVFRAPVSAMTSDNTDQKTLQLGTGESVSEGKAKDEVMPDRKGYNFSGCSPSHIMTAEVKNNKIVFPGGAEFELLVLPGVPAMTPELLSKIEELINAGAKVIGNPPKRAPGLENFPECDNIISEKVKKIWGEKEVPGQINIIEVGNGSIIWGKELYERNPEELHPHYDITAGILKEMGIKKDFVSSPDLRYIHKKLGDDHVYFISNKTDKKVNTPASFRVSGLTPELWDPINGETRILPDFEDQEGISTINLQFEPYQSYFIVFSGLSDKKISNENNNGNFPEYESYKKVEGPWEVTFDTNWGGPGNVTFESLTDWTENTDPGIRYYSGIATYENNLDISGDEINTSNKEFFLNTGKLYNMARVFVNGKDMGVIWTAPWQVNITDALSAGNNNIEIHVANLWPNRLIGDEKLPDDGVKNNKWPEWLLKGNARTSGRHTFASYDHFDKDEELLTSGLLEPVKILTINK